MMKSALKAAKWLLLMSGILIVLYGIIMLFTPLENLIVLALFIGASMLLSGISEITSYFSGEKGCRSGWMLSSGIVSSLLAAWVLFGRGNETPAKIMPIAFAIVVISSGIMRIVGTITVKSKESNLWGWMLFFGVLGSALGFLLLFSPALSAVIISYSIAFMLISYGIDNIAIFFYIKKIDNHIRKHFGERN